MQNQKIQEIIKIAHEIDCRINLFEGYTPKETETYKGELLFWRQVVNLYGLFADCDRVQVKEKRNLLDLMNRYSLIERADYDMAKGFWNDVSEIRKWFCHNNDNALYYSGIRVRKIKEYLNRAFVLSSNKPEKIEDIVQKDWSILTFDMERRFDEYLNIIKKGLLSWQNSNDFEDLMDEWIELFANALFSDKELIQNVLADIASYEKKNQGINMSVSLLVNSYYKQLESGGFSEKDIEEVLKQNIGIIKSNKDIVLESIRNSNLI